MTGTKRTMILDNTRNPSSRAASTATRSLLDLGEDIIALIMEELQAVSPHSVSSLALVHSSCARLARGCRYRKIDFDHSPVACERLRVVRDKQLLTAVRCLTIKGTLEWAESHDWTLIEEVLPRMTGLREITIVSNDVPLAIIATVRNLPKARLHLSARPYDVEECVRLERFRNVAQLYSFDLHVAYGGDGLCRAATKALKVVLLACSNIRVLRINIHMRRGGCVITHPPPGYLGCGFRQGERLPPLEVLELIEYPFGWASQYQGFDGWARNAGSECEAWARMFDWSQLRRLKTAETSFAAALMPHLPALKDFELLDLQLNEPQELRDVYDAIPAGLEHISAPNLDCIGLENLLRHGSHVTSLRLHNPAIADYNWAGDGDSVSESSLRAICQGCPNLQALHIDLARRGHWPYAIFDIIACIPQLRTLTLYCELEDHTDDRPSDGLIRPLVTFTSSSSIYEYLRDHRPSTFVSPIIKELTVVSGWPPRPSRGRVSSSYFFARDNCTFRCALSERDDEAARGVFVTSCLDLDASTNMTLQHAFKTSKALDNRLRSLRNRQVDGKIPVSSRSHRIATKRVRDLAQRHALPEAGHLLRVAWEGPNYPDLSPIQG